MSVFNYGEAEAKEALRQIYREYGAEMATNIERLYRWETAHFTSLQYKRTGSPGMESTATGKAPYYGWNSTPWKARPELAPCRTFDLLENKGMSGTPGANAQVTDTKKRFLVFPTVYAAMYAVAEYIKRHNGNFARWYSTTAAGQELYRTNLAKVRPRFTDAIKLEA